MAVVDWKNRTSTNVAEQVKKDALRNFENHEIVKEGEGRFFCFRRYRDGSKWDGKIESAYHFRVVFSPGHVILLGDLGSMILSVNRRDSLAWLLDCIHQRDYVLSKIDGGVDGFKPRKKLYDGDVYQALMQEIQEHWNDAGACPGPEDAEEGMGGDGPHVFDFDEIPDVGGREVNFENVRPCQRCEKEFKLCPADKALQDWLSSMDHDENAAWRAYVEHTGDCETPFDTAWCARTWWQYWALAWFVQMYDPRLHGPDKPAESGL